MSKQKKLLNKIESLKKFQAHQKKQKSTSEISLQRQISELQLTIFLNQAKIAEALKFKTRPLAKSDKNSNNSVSQTTITENISVSNFTGNGELTFQNGDLYRDQFSTNKFNGYGIYTYNNGRVYKGYWKNHKKHGFGDFFLDGDFYTRQWSDDLYSFFFHYKNFG
jgi:hypothetical protein